MAPEKKKRGRPGREPQPGERVMLGCRVTPETKQRIDEVAQHTGRSQSQQIELLIEQALRDEGRDPMLLASVYGRRLAGLLTALANAMWTAGTAAAYGERRTDYLADWMDDKAAVHEAVLALRTVLSDIDDSPLPDVRESVGVSIAHQMLALAPAFQEAIKHFRPSKTKEKRRG
jgi:predicted DNA-binding protein